MARTNMNSVRVKPVAAQPVTVEVIRREQLTPHFVRVTLGGGDVERFRSLGFDQWLRLFIPVSDRSLAHVPDRLSARSYLRLLAVPRADRPVLRSFSVRAHRDRGPGGPEIDVDFVVHSPADDAGPAAAWAQRCRPGEAVALIDEGLAFNPPPSVRHTVLVADESGVPAAAAVLASLPDDATGMAVLEVPSREDVQEVAAPAGVEVTWLPRDAVDRTDDLPGRLALEIARSLPVPADPFFGWVVGESSLPVAMRRHWVARGVPKGRIVFCGYWKSGRAY